MGSLRVRWYKLLCSAAVSMHPGMGMHETLPRARTGTSWAVADRLIGESQGWADFWSALRQPDSGSKRDAAFERLTQLYLQTAPEYRTQLRHVWLLNEVPESVSAHL